MVILDRRATQALTEAGESGLVEIRKGMLALSRRHGLPAGHT